MTDIRYDTEGGFKVQRRSRPVPVAGLIDGIRRELDDRRGLVFSSNYEYPGRYTRWDMGLTSPPLVLEAKGRVAWLKSLNERGRLIAEALATRLKGPEITSVERQGDEIVLKLARPEASFTEEERVRQPSVFSVIRRLVDLFRSDEDPHLGLYGAFGYDLAFQLDPVKPRLKREKLQRDLVLYLPDEITIVDHYSGTATHHSYEFEIDGRSTAGLKRDFTREPFTPAARLERDRDHTPGAYADIVRTSIEYFKRGDLFEVVPGQTFYERMTKSPSALSLELTRINPSPYGFMINLGENEYLVGASPEMFVRVAGKRIETCPISGTIARGADAIADAEQIRTLLNSKKDEAELTMCSDVDRNDKSRVCVPGSVRVIGRRQIEMYSRLIHTVDHIEGQLREDRDALDGFLSHAWAVTVTGAPKLWAMRFIEEHEASPRCWYGGAVGVVGFNGDLNTGLTLRTIRLKNGIAEVRAGATLLADSDPDAEERETELKASAMLAAIRATAAKPGAKAEAAELAPGQGLNVLLVDHEDSFVHTLAGYLRRLGAGVTTVRGPLTDALLAEYSPHLVVLSPGPGRPVDFKVAETIAAVREREIPLFGVCLGLQGIAEALGGALARLDVPMHGKPSVIRLSPSPLFDGLPREITVGRYHSLIADRGKLPKALRIVAETDDGVIMGLEHESEPISAVQFHPESIMTLDGGAGLKILANVVNAAARRANSRKPKAKKKRG